MLISNCIPKDPESEEWDVIVIGTGMGGSTLGYELAQLGRRVLFVEKGRFLQDLVSNKASLVGCSEQEARLLKGRWPLRLKGTTSFGPVEFYGPLGCGTGGSTALYGGQLERFSSCDFQPRENFAEASESNLPEAWPISYDELQPFYRRAEILYRVCGTADPLNIDRDITLREPPALSDRDQCLFDSFCELGLHPYRSHLGYHYISDCWECLDLCFRNCKSDAGNCSLIPALSRYDASILLDCEVRQLIADSKQIKQIRANWHGREVFLSAKIIVLATGAFMTPVLLLRSNSSHWPNGLANSSGFVGRNLMLHTSDFVIIDQPEMLSEQGPRKSISLNDFYYNDGKKLGTFQSLGIPLMPPYILGYLRYLEEKDPRWRRPRTDKLLTRIADFTAQRYRRSSLFSTIVEDLPYFENRVILDSKSPGGWCFKYFYPNELRQRNFQLWERIKQTIGSHHKTQIVTGSRNNINYGHVCGTCRFGHNPSTSVLNSSNRAHELDNLYIVDSSFFPSSGGTNPSLTVAANALRVGEIIDRHLG